MGNKDFKIDSRDLNRLVSQTRSNLRRLDALCRGIDRDLTKLNRTYLNANWMNIRYPLPKTGSRRRDERPDPPALRRPRAGSTDSWTRWDFRSEARDLLGRQELLPSRINPFQSINTTLGLIISLLWFIALPIAFFAQAQAFGRIVSSLGLASSTDALAQSLLFVLALVVLGLPCGPLIWGTLVAFTRQLFSKMAATNHSGAVSTLYAASNGGDSPPSYVPIYPTPIPNVQSTMSKAKKHLP